MMTTRRRPSNGRYAVRSTTSRTWSTLMTPVSPGSTMSTSACTRRAMRVQEAQMPQASLLEESTARTGVGQFTSCASATAAVALPDAVRPREDQARRQRCPRRRSGHEIQQMTMTDDVTKRHIACARILSPDPPLHWPPGRRSAFLRSSSFFRSSSSAFLRSFSSSPRPKMRPQKPRFFFGSSTRSSFRGRVVRDRRVRRRSRCARRGGRQPHVVGRHGNPGVFAEDAGQALGERGRVERADFGGLRPAHEVLGVDHRTLSRAFRRG